MDIELTGGLKVLAIGIMAKFLQHRDNSMKYVSLKSMKYVSLKNL